MFISIWRLIHASAFCGGRWINLHTRGATIGRWLARKSFTQPICHLIQCKRFLVVENGLYFGEMVRQFLQLRPEIIEGLGGGILAQLPRGSMCFLDHVHGIVDILGHPVPVRHGELLSGTDLFHY